MTGCTFKRKLRSGRVVWGYSLDAGKDEAGTRKRIFKSGFQFQREAEAARLKVLKEMEDGVLAQPDPRTLGEFFNQWLEEYAQHQCSRKTVERYRELARHVTKHLGQTPLGKVTPLQLQRVYNTLLTSGKKNGTPLSRKTVRHVHGLVHVALQTAVKWHLLRLNPADACSLPPLPAREAHAIDQNDTIRFMTACKEHWIGDLLRVAAASGARRGELLALPWPDVDLAAATITIQFSLEQTKEYGLKIKGTKGRNIRKIGLDPETVDVLLRVREKQDLSRSLFGANYRSDLDLVFCQADGSFIRPDVVTKAARRLAKRAGFSGVSLHTMRHSHGSQMLSLGVPLPTVSKRLGHANVNVTATIYAHALPNDEAEAAAIWGKGMKAAKESAPPEQLQKKFEVIRGRRSA
jgi:integrase